MELEKLNIPIEKIKQLQNKKLYSVEDVASFFPRKYYDYSHPKTMDEVRTGERCSMVINIREVNTGRSADKRDANGRIRNGQSFVILNGREVETGRYISIMWMHQDYKYNEVCNLVGLDAIVCGKFTIDNRGDGVFFNPDIFSTDIEGNKKIMPVYSAIRGMSKAYIENVVRKSLELIDYSESVPEDAIKAFNMVDEEFMYRNLHNPSSIEALKKASQKKIFDILYDYADNIIKQSELSKKNSEYIPVKLDNCNKVAKNLPYRLTKDQAMIINEFLAKSRKGERVNALLQGDVGSGKTVCAFLLMLCMCDNGYQSALMAPTGILARQHCMELRKYVEPLGLNVVYLGGELKAAEKKAAYKLIESGEADFVVGTHAVISDAVKFKNLGLIVVDEEHKFGVIQREALLKKADEGVHCINMSATPIPRSLAMSLYGDFFDIYTIETMPEGRLPIKTYIVDDRLKTYSFIEEQIKQGHQAYIVCPLIGGDDYIEDEEKSKPVSVEQIEKEIKKFYGNKDINVGVITGKAKDEEKTRIIDEFKQNNIQVLIATTIIEVGVNVPNATVIAIMDSDRFGLAGLHQLRGRVGRNSLQSYCLLNSKETDNERLIAMKSSTNGFDIAREDLKLRGAGEFIGTRQSGNDKNVELMLKYPKMYSSIQNFIRKKEGILSD